ncbi:purple acid phosphatase family protein [Echinicola soli]|nr:metallophosphoesterase family protein [Echinicola soli]
MKLTSLLSILALFMGLGQLSAQDFAPGPFPDRIVLTWNGDPRYTQAVSWRTSTQIKQGTAQITVAPDSPHLESSAKSHHATVESLIQEGDSSLYHTVSFENLKPGTLYAYRVGSEDHWSEWFHFKTAPEAPEEFSFIYFGDAQNDLKSRWSRVIRQAYSSMSDAAFMLHAGDLINRTHADAEWGEWNHAGGFIHAMIPSIPTPGNHEYDRDQQERLELDIHWRKQFNLPLNGPKGFEETVYYTDYGNARIISLNSQEIVLNDSSRTRQQEWLEKVLQENTQDWTIITFHHPIYSSSSGRDNKEFREAFQPLFEAYGVDLVLQGHDHTYGRGHNLSTGVSGKSGKGKGPVYVVSVSGPKMYELTTDKWMDRAASETQLYQFITIKDNKLTYRTHTATGKLYDAFYLVKDHEGNNSFTDEAATAIEQRTDLPPRKLREKTPEELQEYEKVYPKKQ